MKDRGKLTCPAHVKYNQANFVASESVPAECGVEFESCLLPGTTESRVAGVVQRRPSTCVSYDACTKFMTTSPHGVNNFVWRSTFLVFMWVCYHPCNARMQHLASCARSTGTQGVTQQQPQKTSTEEQPLVFSSHQHVIASSFSCLCVSLNSEVYTHNVRTVEERKLRNAMLQIKQEGYQQRARFLCRNLLLFP